MAKLQWAGIGFMLLGMALVQSAGCGSSNNTGQVGGGGPCCKCTLSAGACEKSETVVPPANVTDCTSFCAGQTISGCPSVATQTTTGVSVACPSGLNDGGISQSDGITGGGFNDGAVVNGDLGSPCDQDGDCATGLTCLKKTDNISPTVPGGVPNGLCTADCSSNTSVCAAHGGPCVSFDSNPNAVAPKAFCLESCTPGDPQPSENKCHNRPDMYCDSSNGASGFCSPLCTTDADCGNRHCSSAGLCVDTPRAGTPLGGPCMANATGGDDSCSGGVCLPIHAPADGGPASVAGVCSGLCVVGAQEACGWRKAAASPSSPIGACLVAVDDNGGLGDLGLCYQLCDGDQDCTQTPGDKWVCDLTITGVDKAFGHAGVCLVETPDSGMVMPKPEDAGTGGQ